MNSKISATTRDKVLDYISSHPLVWNTITTTVLGSFGKGVGFLIPFFVATWFGVSAETDVFFFAYGLIIFLATIFSPVIESIIVPFIAEARAKGEDVGAFIGKILGMSAVGLSVLSLVFLIVIKPILAVITSFSSDGLDLTFLILLESAPLVVLLVWTSVLAGTLNAYKVFGIPALSPAFRAVVTLGFIFAFKDKIGVSAIALGYVVGEIFRLFVLFGLLRRLKLFRIKLSLGWEEKFREFFKTSSYQIISMSLVAFTPIVDKTMASWLQPGDVSLLEYADRLFFIPSNLLSMGLLTVLLSKWSSDHYNNIAHNFNTEMPRLLKTVASFVVIISVGFFLLSGFITDRVYGNKNITGGDIERISTLFSVYVLGIPAIIIGHIFSRGLLVLKDTIALFKVAAFKTVMNIALNLLFIYYFGLTGIVASSTVTAFLAMTVYYIYFRSSLSKGEVRELQLQGKVI